MNADHLAPGFRNSPYWQDTTGPLANRVVQEPDALPEHAEVAIIGAGYTGLSAALTLARSRAGKSWCSTPRDRAPDAVRETADWSARASINSGSPDSPPGTAR